MAEIERLEQERKTEHEKRKREEHEKETFEKKHRKEEEYGLDHRQEYERWHRPEIVGTWGGTVLECPQCSTLNSVNLENCRKCSASLKSAPRVKNPYS